MFAPLPRSMGPSGAHSASLTRSRSRRRWSHRIRYRGRRSVTLLDPAARRGAAEAGRAQPQPSSRSSGPCGANRQRAQVAGPCAAGTPPRLRASPGIVRFESAAMSNASVAVSGHCRFLLDGVEMLVVAQTASASSADGSARSLAACESLRSHAERVRRPASEGRGPRRVDVRGDGRRARFFGTRGLSRSAARSMASRSPAR